MLQRALELKRKGIIPLDNFIYLNGFTAEEVGTFAERVEKEFGMKTEIRDIEKIVSNIDPKQSHETNATRFIYEMQQLRDEVISSNSFFIICNIESYYSNSIVNLLKTCNISFLVWYISFNPSFYPLLTINRNEEEVKVGLITKCCKIPENLLDTMKEGLKELFETVERENSNENKSVRGEESC